MSDGYQVQPDALRETAQGIEGAVEALKGLGFGQSNEIGRGFSELEMKPAQLSSPEVYSAFFAFCERWAWGVRTLIQDGNEIAHRLHLSAGLYHDQEEYLSGTLKDVAHAALGGNPTAQPQQIEHESWGAVSSDNPINDVLHPADGPGSFEQAGRNIAHTWAPSPDSRPPSGPDPLARTWPGAPVHPDQEQQH